MGCITQPNYYYRRQSKHEGDEQTEWTDATYGASSALISDISARWNIPLDRNHIIGPITKIYAKKAWSR